jgi:hypothetical protein
VVYGILPSGIANSSKNISSVNAVTDERLSIFPNPAQKQLTIKYHDETVSGGKVLIEIINTLGEVVYSNNNNTINDNALSLTISLPSAIQDGIYVVKVTNAKGNISTKQLIIKN